MMSDKEFAELELRVAICPGQCQWPKPENIIWQKLHNAASEARERVSRFYALADEIDRNAVLSEDDKYCQRGKAADEAFADFEASKTLARARETVRYDGSPDMLKALKEAEVGWKRAMNKIAERTAQTKPLGHAQRCFVG
jgi:hypothetical protein